MGWLGEASVPFAASCVLKCCTLREEKSIKGMVNSFQLDSSMICFFPVKRYHHGWQFQLTYRGSHCVPHTFHHLPGCRQGLFFSPWLNETRCSNERNPFPQLETAKQSNPVSASAKQRGRMDSLQSSPSSAEHTRCGVAALTDVLAWLSWNSHVVAMVQVKPI